MYIARKDAWYMERIIWLIAGVMSLGSAILAWCVSPYWLILTGLVGINLIIFALTGFCVMANVLYHFGIRSCCQIKVKQIVTKSIQKEF